MFRQLIKDDPVEVQRVAERGSKSNSGFHYTAVSSKEAFLISVSDKKYKKCSCRQTFKLRDRVCSPERLEVVKVLKKNSSQ